MSLEITGVAQRQSWIDNVMPPTERVADGIWSIPVPIPANPLRYVLVYAFETPTGVAIVDAGWNTDEAWEALQAGLKVGGFAVSDVEAVLVTHIHPDHYGLAGRVREGSDAWIGLHPADAALIPGRYGAGMDDVVKMMRSLLETHGVPVDVTAELTGASFGIRDFVDAVQPDRLIEDNERVDVPGWDIRALHTPGHSPGHLCFHVPQARVLLSGDCVLPHVSPNISVHAQQFKNPLADFLEALQRLSTLDVDEVLPAHEWRFRPLQARIDELTVHHHQRLDETEACLRTQSPATCWEVAQRLSWSHGWEEISGFMRRAAVGETLAHLVLLESQARIERQGDNPVRWVPVG